MTDERDILIRMARADDLDAVVALLVDDPLGAERETPGAPAARCYTDAFAAMAADPNQDLLIVEHEGVVAGYLELSFVQGLSRQGMLRAQIESVRIAPQLRGKGVGRQMFEAAFTRAEARGAAMIQLTTDKTRPDAIRFYEGLGFTASHEGMKKALVEY